MGINNKIQCSILLYEDDRVSSLEGGLFRNVLALVIDFIAISRVRSRSSFVDEVIESFVID